ncbi:MAG: dihydroorotate dehydrogenase [Candidatus Magasanikbacteria bacterium CG10_big_fil_rev_8_21_14_0_10_40_10]|uniref:Dihydroorotate dehydrogenase n=1 Tax=Candidatus Magasanikbacteria bacterium CG10_big_fil_rev_8_21_14_0_10_40_10 TaxID=1974648 RepID=A0A2M6W3U1_9BACT|nr:MAG: dihydroorotate dehydrogenase [Candidatus Magasanikbacteria bacterium CG10_big_fil_rev_8_21_14_0_10_40_10]
MLQTDFLDKKFSNPIVLASGILGVTAASLKNAINNGCGGVTTKSVSIEPRPGHANPTMVGAKQYFINAVGLSNPGVESAVEEMKKFKQISDSPLIGSIFAGSFDEFAQVTEKISDAPLDFLEVNISCPNVMKEFGEPFAYSTQAATTITKKVKAKANVPILIKLSPNAWNIVDIAKAVEAAGADGLVAVNTISGIAIDIYSRKPILHNKQGGVSGPALFPIALNCVYSLAQAVKIPIIGTGGITTGEDALAMIMAGATLLGIGSAVYFRGEDVFKKITDEMKQIMREENIKSLDEIRGCAYKN